MLRPDGGERPVTRTQPGGQRTFLVRCFAVRSEQLFNALDTLRATRALGKRADV
jgi:hypothetical protein